MFSQGGRSRTWQKTWQRRSAGSGCPYSSCKQHMRQKWAIRCWSVLLWCAGNALNRPCKAASHCSADSNSTHQQNNVINNVINVSLTASTVWVKKVKKVKFSTCYSAFYMRQTQKQKHFTILDVAADWHELMIPQRTMRPSIACVSEQLDPQIAASRHTTAPISHTRLLPRSPEATTHFASHGG